MQSKLLDNFFAPGTTTLYRKTILQFIQQDIVVIAGIRTVTGSMTKAGCRGVGAVDGNEDKILTPAGIGLINIIRGQKTMAKQGPMA